MGKEKWPCVILIGMPGVGKTTIGKLLARELQWAFMDTDAALEALYAAPLQSVTDALGKESFLSAECSLICSLRLNRCVIATGGSVVYQKKAMQHLGKLGPIVHVYAPFETIEARVAEKPDRGIAIGPGQTLADLYAEREALYKKYAVLKCDSERLAPEECARFLAQHLKNCENRIEV